MDVVDLTFLQEVIYSLFSGPYQNPMPFFVLAWGPDYPDPTDYVAPMYKADGSYTASDTVWEQLSSAGPGNSSFWTASCPTADVPPNALWGATPNSLNGPISNLVTWARLAGTGKGAGTPGIPTSCQGGAYAEMNWAMAVAAQLAAGPERVLVYNLVSQIASALSLYTWIGQVNQIVTYAPWINPATFDTNVILLGGNFPDTPWFDIGAPECFRPGSPKPRNTGPLDTGGGDPFVPWTSSRPTTNPWGRRAKNGRSGPAWPRQMGALSPRVTPRRPRSSDASR